MLGGKVQSFVHLYIVHNCANYSAIFLWFKSEIHFIPIDVNSISGKYEAKFSHFLYGQHNVP